MTFHRLMTLVIFYVLLILSRHALAESMEQAEDSFSNAQNAFFKALKSGKYNSPEEKEKIQQSTIGAANAKLSQAAHEQTERLREQEIERQRSNAAVYAQKKSRTSSSEANGATQGSARELNRKKPSISEPTEEAVVIDGSTTPKELIFPGNKAKPRPTKK